MGQVVIDPNNIRLVITVLLSTFTMFFFLGYIVTNHKIKESVLFGGMSIIALIAVIGIFTIIFGISSALTVGICTIIK